MSCFARLTRQWTYGLLVTNRRRRPRECSWSFRRRMHCALCIKEVWPSDGSGVRGRGCISSELELQVLFSRDEEGEVKRIPRWGLRGGVSLINRDSVHRTIGEKKWYTRVVFIFVPEIAPFPREVSTFYVVIKEGLWRAIMQRQKKDNRPLDSVRSSHHNIRRLVFKWDTMKTRDISKFNPQMLEWDILASCKLFIWNFPLIRRTKIIRVILNVKLYDFFFMLWKHDSCICIVNVLFFRTSQKFFE